LAVGKTVREAAAAAEVAESSVYRWLKREDFRQQVSDLRTELLSRAVGKLAEQSGAAADVLGALLSGVEERTRLAAAKAILELGPRLREAGELAGRVEAIEAEIRRRKGRR
jgi:hypothetical protein